MIAGELQREWEIWAQAPDRSAGEEDWEGKESGSGRPRSPGTENVPESREQGEGDDFQGERTLLRTIRDYGDKSNINMVLIDSNTGATILGAGRDSDYLVQKVQRYVLGVGKRHASLLREHENYVIETNYDTRFRSTYMESWGFLSDNRTLFIMSMPLASIRECDADEPVYYLCGTDGSGVWQCPDVFCHKQGDKAADAFGLSVRKNVGA